MDDEKPSLPLSFAFFERMTEPERRPLLIKYTDRLDFYLKDGVCQSAERLEFDLEMFGPGRIYAILRDIGIYCIAARRNYYIDKINLHTNLSHKSNSSIYYTFRKGLFNACSMLGCGLQASYLLCYSQRCNYRTDAKTSQ